MIIIIITIIIITTIIIIIIIIISYCLIVWCEPVFGISIIRDAFSATSLSLLFSSDLQPTSRPVRVLSGCLLFLLPFFTPSLIQLYLASSFNYTAASKRLAQPGMR